MSKKNTDSVTLKNVTGKAADSLFVLKTVKPQIGSIPRSNLLQRVRGFLPQMQEANKDLSMAPVMNFEVMNCVESSSSEDSDTSSDEESEPLEELQNEPLPTERVVQMDINLFRAKDEVSEDNAEVQEVVEVPLAFRKDAELLEESPKKKNIEVLDS